MGLYGGLDVEDIHDRKGLTARFVKISDDFYLEKIQKNDIK